MFFRKIGEKHALVSFSKTPNKHWSFELMQFGGGGFEIHTCARFSKIAFETMLLRIQRACCVNTDWAGQKYM